MVSTKVKSGFNAAQSKVIVKTSPLHALLTLSGRKVIELSGAKVTIGDSSEAYIVNSEVKKVDGLFWSKIKVIKPNGQKTQIGGFRKKDSERVVKIFSKNQKEQLALLETHLLKLHECLEPIHRDLKSELESEYYLPAKKRKLLLTVLESNRYNIESAHKLVNVSTSQQFEINASLKSLSEFLFDYLTKPEKWKDRNEEFVRREFVTWKTFFDRCEERPLTEEQAKAAIIFEENTLLIAAAGSGKTSTVVGKAAYAIAKGLVKPHEIICLAFNNDAADEIKTRLKQRLEAICSPESQVHSDIKKQIKRAIQNSNVESRTFHGLGRYIIQQVGNNGYRTYNANERKDNFQRALSRCKESDSFLSKWILLQTVYRFPQPTDTSKFINEKDYQEYLKGVWKSKTQGEGVLSLGTTEPVRSFEELAISNWLFVMGVKFQYERPIECSSMPNWNPDFTYQLLDKQNQVVTIIHEHFALNSDGKAPHFFDNPENYAKQAESKKKVLKGIDERNFWTTSSQFRDGTIFEFLETKLQSLNISFSPRSEQEILERLKFIGQSEDHELLNRAVSLMRQNSWSKVDLLRKISSQTDKNRAALFIDVVGGVAETLTRIVLDSKPPKLDFDEMMRRAIQHLEAEPSLLNKRLIIADEFQDTAPGRARLMKLMLSQIDYAHLFAVGDDWQAINRFAGSDIRFFHKFGDYFNKLEGANESKHLTQVFRSNQGISDIASHLVLKNKSQLEKSVISNDQNTDGVCDIHDYYGTKELQEKIESQIELWIEQHKEKYADEPPTILLLGRYGSRRLVDTTPEFLTKMQEKFGDRVKYLKVKVQERLVDTIYMTMHSSKGLQADYVMLLGFHSVKHNFMCFPSERENDPLLELVLPQKEARSDADERRLMYVALTRAKHQVMICMHRQFPSTFAMEILRDHRDGKVLFNGKEDLPDVCPKCETGVILKKYNARSGKFYKQCSSGNGCSSR